MGKKGTPYDRFSGSAQIPMKKDKGMSDSKTAKKTKSELDKAARKAFRGT